MASTEIPPNPKADVAELIDALPENATWDDIEYAMYVRRKVREGQSAVDAGRYFTHEEVLERLSQWTR